MLSVLFAGSRDQSVVKPVVLASTSPWKSSPIQAMGHGIESKSGDGKRACCTVRAPSLLRAGRRAGTGYSLLTRRVQGCAGKMVQEDMLCGRAEEQNSHDGPGPAGRLGCSASPHDGMRVVTRQCHPLKGELCYVPHIRKLQGGTDVGKNSAA